MTDDSHGRGPADGGAQGAGEGPGEDAGGFGRRTRSGVARDRSALARLGADPGLCATCEHLELVGSRRSVFVRCGLSDRDPAFPRYPPLPVRRCAGWRPEPEASAARDAQKENARPGLEGGGAGGEEKG